MESRNSDTPRSRVDSWIALAFCAAVLVAGVLEQLVRDRPAYARSWIPLAAAGLAVAGIVRVNGRPVCPRVRPALLWSAFVLMVWAANGLPLDLLRMVPGRSSARDSSLGTPAPSPSPRASGEHAAA